MLVWAFYCLLLAVRESVSELVQCYKNFDEKQGSCGHLLGEVEVNDCCRNPHYGYGGNDIVCQSCRPARWTDWTPWGPCSVSCLEGVQQRRRFYYGMGISKDTQDLVQLETKSCQESDCCPKQGGWSDWGAWQACSVSCGVGKKLRERMCSSPPPTCRGSCAGPSSESSPCDTGMVCPVHGSWSAWGPWGTCGSSCVREGSGLPVRQSTRFCTNPAPSTDPPGLFCPGLASKTEPCVGLPYCAVHGGWGLWAEYGGCSVTCGLGERVRMRSCDSPAPQHGGNYCPGDNTASLLCNTTLDCPVDGQWSEWSAWSECKRTGKDIRCSTYSAGRQTRDRSCEHRKWNGSFCIGKISETRPCSNIDRCTHIKGDWSEWSEWGLCKPSCGPGAQKTRIRTCLLDLSGYKNLHVGPNNETVHFFGKPRRTCPLPLPKPQDADCLNVPACAQP
ncbi:hypothetical protein AAFF_G00142600 [Aldrovandia affinis]|uniref:Properdin n=1 Tax=Aldrovandia affinis TaxID=143900 RepID=A0AAD7T0W7_9TELE|nr:hypothetical protein AAFF_G00142600 [Aldrovandia affinis]